MSKSGRKLAILALCMALQPNGLRAQAVISLTPADRLAAAVESAAEGTTILLASGDYGPLILRGISGSQAAPITLRSADPANPAKLSQLNLREVNHLVLDGLLFDYTFSAQDSPSERPFQIFTSRNIVIENSVFDGDLAPKGTPEQPAYPTGFGLSLRSSATIRIDHNEFRNFYRGLVVNDVVDLQINANDVHDIRMDGMNFVQVERVLIEGNTIHDFNRAVDSDDHADMIQFWTNQSERPSVDITIRNNVLNSGLGWFTQSIFMRNDQVDRELAGKEMFYRNITIEGNVIINAHLHGITVGETDGLIIRNNTVLHNARSDGKKPNRAQWIPQVRVSKSAVNVQILNNVLHKITGHESQPSWTVTGNQVVSDRGASQSSDYDVFFVAAQTGDPRDLGSFQYRSEGGLAEAGIGAPMLNAKAVRPQPLNQTAMQSPIIHVVADRDLPNRFAFSMNADGGGLDLDIDPSQITWDFGDGHNATGPQVRHDYALAGTFEVKLQIDLASGRKLASFVRVRPRPAVVIQFDQTTGAMTTFASDPPSILDLALVPGPIQLGGDNPVITVPREAIAPLFGGSYFNCIQGCVQTRATRRRGTILQIYKTLAVSVNRRGAFEVEFSSQTAQKLRLTTPASRVLIDDWVDVTVEYSDNDRQLRVIVNGKLVASGQTSGPVRPVEHWGLVLGHAFKPNLSFKGEMAQP